MTTSTKITNRFVTWGFARTIAWSLCLFLVSKNVHQPLLQAAAPSEGKTYAFGAFYKNPPKHFKSILMAAGGLFILWALHWYLKKDPTQKIVLQYGYKGGKIKSVDLNLNEKEQKNISVLALAQTHDPEGTNHKNRFYKGEMSGKKFEVFIKNTMKKTYAYCRSNQSLFDFIDQRKGRIKSDSIYLFFFQVKKPEADFSIDIEIKKANKESIKKEGEEYKQSLLSVYQAVKEDLPNQLSEEVFYKTYDVYIKRSEKDKTGQRLLFSSQSEPSMGYTLMQALVDAEYFDKNKTTQTFKLLLIDKQLEKGKMLIEWIKIVEGENIDSTTVEKIDEKYDIINGNIRQNDLFGNDANLYIANQENFDREITAKNYRELTKEDKGLFMYALGMNDTLLKTSIERHMNANRWSTRLEAVKKMTFVSIRRRS